MTTAAIVSFWVTGPDGGPDMDVTRFVDTGNTSFVGLSSQPSPVGSPVICLLETDDATIIPTIEADPLCGDSAILWSTNPKPPGDGVSGREFGRLRSLLARVHIGMTPQEIHDAIGNGPGGRTRLEIQQDLTDWRTNN